MTRVVRRTLQERLEALVSDFTKQILRAVREAPLGEILPRRLAERVARSSSSSGGGSSKAPSTRARPAVRAAAVRAPLRREPKRAATATRKTIAPATKKPSAAVATGEARWRSVETKETLDDALLRHLRAGVLLTVDQAAAVVGASESLLSGAVDRLVSHGLIGVTGEGIERFLFASKGDHRPVPRAPELPKKKASRPRRVPAILAPSADKAPAAPVESPPIAAPDAPPSAPGAHPFVVRRKKAAGEA